MTMHRNFGIIGTQLNEITKMPKSAIDRLWELEEFAVSFDSAIVDLMMLQGELTPEEFEKRVKELEGWLHDMG